MAQRLSKNQEVIFPEESRLVIEEILKKYKLYRETEEIMKKMAQEIVKAQTSQEKIEIAEKQPEIKLAKVIKEVAEGKITLEEFSKELQQAFNIPSKIAKELAKDLEKNVLAFAKRVVIEKEVMPPVKRPLMRPLPVARPPKELLETPPPKPKAAPPKVKKPEIPLEEKKPQKPDIYREQI